MWPPRRVKVDWIDSMTRVGWECYDDAVIALDEPNKMEHQSCGYLVKETDAYIALTHSVGVKIKNCCDVIQIPKCSVTKIRRLK